VGGLRGFEYIFERHLSTRDNHSPISVLRTNSGIHRNLLTEQTVSDIAKSGSTLAFIIYPEGLATLPFAWLWSMLFFGMLFLMGIDSQVSIYVSKVSLMDQPTPTDMT
jgi:SNF family Na+-dependent transporter